MQEFPGIQQHSDEKLELSRLQAPHQRIISFLSDPFEVVQIVPQLRGRLHMY